MYIKKKLKEKHSHIYIAIGVASLINTVWTIPCHVLCVYGPPCLGQYKHKQVNKGHPENLDQSPNLSLYQIR